MLKITERILSVVGSLKSAFGSQTLGNVVFQRGQPRLIGTTDDQFENNSIIQSCLVSILGAFTSVQLVSATKGDNGDDLFDYQTEFAKLLRRPDPDQKLSQRRFLKAMLASYILDGNAYALVEKDNAGDAVKVSYIPHAACKPKADKDGYLKEYEIAFKDGTCKPYDPAVIIHIADGIDSKDGLKGCSPLKSVLLQVMTDSEADLYSSEIINNPEIVGWAFIPKNKPNGEGPGKENSEYMEAKISAKYGRGGRGKVMVPATEGTIQVVGFSPEQLVLDKLRKVPEARISAVMDVPAIIAGLQVGLDRSTFSNTEEARKYFVRYRIAPLWETFAEEFTEQLLERCSPAEGERCAFDTRNVQELHEPAKERWDRYDTAYVSGGITRGEYRIGLGFEAEPGRDDVFFQDLAIPMPNAKALKARIQARRRMAEANGIADEE